MRAGPEEVNSPSLNGSFKNKKGYAEYLASVEAKEMALEDVLTVASDLAFGPRAFRINKRR